MLHRLSPAGFSGAGQPTVSRRWDLLRPVLARYSNRTFRPGQGGGPQGNGPGRRHRLPGLGLGRSSGPVFREGEVHGNERADRVQSERRCGCYRLGSAAWRAARTLTHSRRPALKASWRNHWTRITRARTLATSESTASASCIQAAPSSEELKDWQREFNADFSKIRAAVEHAVAKVKTWRMLSPGRRPLPLPE